jgi:hypothetical protein
MKIYTLYGYPPINQGGLATIFSGTFTSYTAAQGSTTIVTPWIPTHFGNDEVAEILCWHIVLENISGTGNLTLDWQGTWDSGATATGDTRVEGLQNMINGGGGVGWIDGALVVSNAVGTRGFLGRTVNGATTAAAGADGQGALSPYVRAILHTGLYSAGTVTLYAGMYGRR